MWMTREEIADKLGIVVNSVRGKVQKGQIERKMEGGKNLYRVIDPSAFHVAEPARPEVPEVSFQGPPEPPIPASVELPVEAPVENLVETQVQPSEPQVVSEAVYEPVRQPVHQLPVQPKPPEQPVRTVFNPKQVLLEQLASMKIGRSIDAIEKGDEIDLATGEISRELEARLSMRQQKQLKDIQDALERLKTGDYGTCEECAETIPEQRLRLFPAARLCVRCQEEADHYERIKQDQGMRGSTWKDDAAEGGYGKYFEE